MLPMINTHAHTRLLMLIFSSCLFLSGCQTLPDEPHLAKSIELSARANEHHTLAKKSPFENDGQPAQQTSGQLSTVIAEQSQQHPALSGYYPIATGANAFAVRSILSDMAAHTIDIQYYIWHNDEAGQLMLKDLYEAAERGVIIRLLLDDLSGSAQFDRVLAKFASHPNVAVRLVNPLVYRKYRSINYILHPLRTNIRMHNKSMTFDNRISVIGGRNIGNEYLNNAPDNNFADLDVLLVGSVVHDITDSFEQYWASSKAYDVQTLVQPTDKDIMASLNEVFTLDNQHSQAASESERALRTYRPAVQNATIGKDLLNKQVPFTWTNIELFVDDASKLKRQSTKDQHLVTQLQQRLGKPEEKFSVISSYFVPTRDGVNTLIKLAKSGVKVRILTNSFHATDVGIVHAGYAHWREDLLKAGVELFEIKSTAQGFGEKENKFWRTKQHSTTSLHAKAFAVDSDQVFIGSYNVDPRSANINTELGVLINDDKLANQLHGALSNSQMLRHQAYELKLGSSGKLEWHTIEDGKAVIYQSEPNMSPTERAVISVVGLLPIDWLL